MRDTVFLSTIGLLSAIACAACADDAVEPPAATTVDPTPAAAAAPTGDTCTPPFTADEIRAATTVGRTYRYKVESASGPTLVRQMRFTEVNGEGTAYESTEQDLEGKPIGERRIARATWAELVKHAAWPAAATSITPAVLDVPAGHFMCSLYTVREGDMITKAYFAKSLPGPPAQMIVEKAGAAVMTLTLLEHTPGEPR